MDTVVAQNVSAEPSPQVNAPSRWRTILSALSTQRSALLLLIFVGAVLRFSFLNRPAIWFDEAATFARTSGTYQQMLDTLEDAGFGPLHYHAYWWIKNGCPLWGKIETVKVSAYVTDDGFGRKRAGTSGTGMVDQRNLVPTHQLVPGGKVTMTPFMLRLIPAICGTLMIPAMYWLAIELSGRRRVALIAAALATFSAYFLDFSRDAKMYMELWLFIVLNIASLLWWLRTRTLLAWSCWIITGTIAIGLHLLGLTAPALSLIMVLTARRAHWKSLVALLYLLILPAVALTEWIAVSLWHSIRAKRAVMREPVGSAAAFQKLARGFRFPILLGCLFGLVLMSIGPYGYFISFNGYVDRINKIGWHGTGVQWIPSYNMGRTGPELARYAASAFFTNWEWPKLRDEKEIAPRVNYWLKNGTFAMLAVAVICLLPWRSVARGWRRWRGHAYSDEPIIGTQSSHWREMFWVILWMVLPFYVPYLLSVHAGDFAAASPMHWLALFAAILKAHAWIRVALPLVAALAFFLSARNWRGRLLHSVFFLLVFIFAFAIVELIWWSFDSKWVDSKMVALVGRSWKYHDSIWIPRYLGAIIPALFIASAVLIARLPGRIVRILAVTIFVAINLGQFSARLFADTEPPVEQMVQDSIDCVANQERGDGSMKMYYSVRPVSLAAGLGPGTGMLGMPTSKYYWVIKTNSIVSEPDQIRGMASELPTHFPISFGSIPNALRRDLKNNPKLKKLIVWDSPRPNETGDKILDALGSEWKLSEEGDEVFTAREHWTWRNLLTIRRKIYVKTAVSATMPATTPATTQSNAR